jgi:hypothetical protein
VDDLEEDYKIDKNENISLLLSPYMIHYFILFLYENIKFIFKHITKNLILKK